MVRRPLVPIPRRPSIAPKRLETDLKTLADAANEAAKREAAQWFYFVTIMLTLAAIVGSTTHRVLFLEDPVKVPLLQVELPLQGFYVAAPAIFVVLHFYLLAQIRLMAGKVRQFLDAVQSQAGDDVAARDLALSRLDTFSAAQLVAADRLGLVRPAVRAMVWVTLVAAPVVLLLFFQLRFLPFHSEGITWWHRVLLAVDLGLIWALWPPLESGLWRRVAIHSARGVAVTGLLLFACGVATIPGEALETVSGSEWGALPSYKSKQGQEPIAIFWDRLKGRDRNHATNRPPDIPAEPVIAALRRALFDGVVDEVSQQASSLFARRLILPDQDFVMASNEVRENLLHTRVLRGRRLEGAVLTRANLRNVDLTGANLQRARLVGAQLQGASLDRAQLQGAALDRAQLQGASLERAYLQGSVLFGTQLRGARLAFARLQGAELRSAQLQGAMLDHAELQGASLDRVQLQGASLVGARLEGASLTSAQLQAANLSGARLQGASLASAQLQAANLSGAALWRTQASGAELRDVDATAITFTSDAPCTGLGRPCARDLSWAQWVDRWLVPVPEGRRRTARGRLDILVRDDAEFPETVRTLRELPAPDQTRIAVLLADIACDAASAPYVARAIARQLDDFIGTRLRALGHAAPGLAARIVAEECRGAQGLTPEERADLIRIAGRAP